MTSLLRVDDLPGTFGYGAGVLYGLPQPPRWMGELRPDLQKVLLLLDTGEMLYGKLGGLDWEGGNVILHSGEEVHSNPIGNLRAVLLSADTRTEALVPPTSVTTTLHYTDGGEWTLSSHSASADLFGVGFFAVDEGEVHAIFVPWRALARNELTLASGLDDQSRARRQREVAFRRGAELDQQRAAQLARVPEPSREAASLRHSAFAKAFCDALGG